MNDSHSSIQFVILAISNAGDERIITESKWFVMLNVHAPVLVFMTLSFT